MSDQTKTKITPPEIIDRTAAAAPKPPEIIDRKPKAAGIRPKPAPEKTAPESTN